MRANKATKIHMRDALKLNTYEEQLKGIANVAKRVCPKKRRYKVRTVTAAIAVFVLWLKAKHPKLMPTMVARLLPMLSAIGRALDFVVTTCAPPVINALTRMATSIVRMLLNSTGILGSAPSLLRESAGLQFPANVMLMTLPSSGKTTRGLMYDGGCTTRMTCSKQGLVGEMQTIADAPEFVTALGKATYDQQGVFTRRIYGSNGSFIDDTGVWLYNPKLPFDVMGAEWMRQHCGSFYHDSTIGSPALELRRCKSSDGTNTLLALGRAKGGTEWLSYEAPSPDRAAHVQNALKWQGTVAMVNVSDEICQNIVLPLNTTGPGMFSLSKALTDLEKAKLDHCVRGHVSLQRSVESQHHSKGGFQLTSEAVKALAVEGCDVCGAYKIKHLQPKAKTPTPEADADCRELKIYYDSFGKVGTPSAQYGYHHAHLFWIPSKLVGWMLGSVALDEVTVGSLIKRVKASVAAWLPDYTVTVIQMDSFSTNRSAYLLDILEQGMIHPQFSPPGQHAFLGDLERMWYVLLVRALIWMRHAEAPKTQWFNAMASALDCECTLVSRMHGTGPNISGYERIGLGVPDVSDMYPFYAPSRIALDKDARPDKWVERSAPAFWTGRNIDFVMRGKTGAGIFWDGHIHRTVVQNFHVTVSKFLNLTAPNNKRLPDFPKDSAPMPSSQPAQPQGAPNVGDAPAARTLINPQPTQPQAAAAQPVLPTAAASRPRRPGADITYTAFTCELDESEPREVAEKMCMLLNDKLQMPSPAADIVIHLCSGNYDNPNGISALLRAAGVGVLDIDNHAQYGGGESANLLNNGVFNFIWQLVRAHRVIGIISGQKCATGTVKRLEAGEGMPEQVLSQEHPNGMPGLNAAYQKEVHDCALLGYRITELLKLVYTQGGWFLAECPEVRGDSQRQVSFDPAFKTHSTVMDMDHWNQLQQQTGAHRVVSAMCALRMGYPQKLESFMLSQNLAPTLGTKLAALECVHPPGTHINSFAGEKHGKWNVSSSQTWMIELCERIRDGILPLTPTGGPSMQLGRDDLQEWVEQTLQWRDAQHLAALRLKQPNVCPSPKAAMILSIMDNLDDHVPSLESTQLDCDPHLGQFALALLEATSDGTLLVDRYDRELADQGYGFALLVKSSVNSSDAAPQTERELRNNRSALLWISQDQVEIDTLFSMGVLEESLEAGADPNIKYWRTRFVRAEKIDPITLKHSLKSRLCCMGTGQAEGQEYFDSTVPTPLWSTTLMLIGECTVAQGIDFQFDCPQFFQQTDCVTPNGSLWLLPPPRYQRKEKGVRVLWRCVKWLQGAKGAGAAARASFNELVTKNDLLVFTVSTWDPSLYIHDSSAGKIRFCLHGDDGCGGWSTSQELVDKLIKLLDGRYGKYKPLKYGKWCKQLGFPVKRDLKKGTTTITAEPYIEGLRSLVAGDLPYFPKTPYSKEINELEPAELPEPGSVEETQFNADISWMREAHGSLIHIGKVRKDALPAINMTSRYSHRPDKKAIRCTKHTIWYLLNTLEIGLTAGYSPDTKWEDLQWSAAPNRDEIFDTMAPNLAYWVNCDGALKLEDRSLSGILHMFAGMCILGLSFRQHSIAISAHDSECFTASSAAAQAIPFRGIMTELGIFQEVPTPIVVDSRSTLLVARCKAAMKKSLYIMRRVLFMQECVDDKEVEYYSCKGKMNLSDCFTKAIYCTKAFFLARRYFMGCAGAAVNT